MSLFSISFRTDSYSNEYLLAKIGVDTAENEPLEVWGKIQFTIHFTPYYSCNSTGVRETEL